MKRPYRPQCFWRDHAFDRMPMSDQVSVTCGCGAFTLTAGRLTENSLDPYPEALAKGSRDA